MRKLLIISEKFWPEGGGAEFATYLISKILSQHFTVSIFTSSKFSKVSDAQVIYVPWLKASNKFTLWLNIVKNKGLIQKNVKKQDIIYVPRASFPVIPIGKKLGKKIVTHLHDYIPISYNAISLAPYEKRRYSTKKDILMLERLKGAHYLLAAKLFSNLTVKLVRRWIQLSDMIIHPSKRSRDIVALQAPELTGLSNSRVIYNPLPNIPLINKQLNEPAFLYVSGDSYCKGFHIFLKATADFSREKCHVRFILVGDFKDESKRVTDSLNRRLCDTYKVVGRIRHEELLKLHSKVRGLVFPSIVEEPLPYAVVESMLAGTIPIASRVGGVPEIVDGTYAEDMLFAPQDVDQIITRMKRVLSLSKEQLLNVGMEMRETVLEHFNNETIERQLLEVFDS